MQAHLLKVQDSLGAQSYCYQLRKKNEKLVDKINLTKGSLLMIEKKIGIDFDCKFLFLIIL